MSGPNQIIYFVGRKGEERAYLTAHWPLWWPGWQCDTVWPGPGPSPACAAWSQQLSTTAATPHFRAFVVCV